MKNDDLREFLKNNLRIKLNLKEISYRDDGFRISVELYLKNEFTGEEIVIDNDNITLNIPN